jgi:hypothetical protein
LYYSLASTADESNAETQQHCEALETTLDAGKQQLAFVEGYEGGSELLRQVQTCVFFYEQHAHFLLMAGYEQKYRRRTSEAGV